MNSHLSWIEASNTCQSLAPTGEGKPLPVTKRHLASITSEAENNFVAGLLHGKVAWLGGVILPDEKTWIWTDGSQFVFKNWKGSEPNNARGMENALVMNWPGVRVSGWWNDAPFTHRFAFVCQYLDLNQFM